jgi:hypothetical protein
MANPKRTPTGHYEVGFCRPPKHRQFKPGESANPRGRPRKSTDYGDMLLRIINQKHVGIADGKSTRMSKFELGLHNLANKAARGDRLAWRELINTMRCLGIKLAKSEKEGRLVFIYRRRACDRTRKEEGRAGELAASPARS